MNPKLKQFLFRFHAPILITVSFTLGVFCWHIFQPGHNHNFTEIRSSGNYKFINPLIECEQASFNEDKTLYTNKEKIEDIINKKINSQDISFASVYYRDLNNGPWFGINEKELFSPSSLIKVPLMMAYFKLAETDPKILTKEIVNTKPYDPDSQNIPPEVTLELNQKYTVEELIHRMIVYSDNLSFDLLNDNIDINVLLSVYKDIGVDISKAQSDPAGNIVSVKSYASFFRILFNSSYLNKDMSEKALQILSQSTYKKGIVAGLPKDTIVAHKFGERQYLETHQRQLHDCGIVYLPKKPYLICIMTRGQDLNKLTTTINEISSTLYKELNTQ